MSTITYDGQSFIIDSRRVWLVSGAIHYARTPRGLWRQRIRAAKEAGLNCIETYVFWNAHERSPGKFNFEGDLDLRAFVEMVGDEGMYCILRPGPYICAEWEFGGLPAWLHRIEGIKFREDNPPFLEACARYIGAVMKQVRDLQVTTPIEGPAPATTAGNVPGQAAGGFTGGGNGPIVMIQAENEWMCHNEEQAQTYLREMVRYLRENGCEVPINNCNNLWQRMEGTIDTWNGSQRLAADLRQLAVVQPNAPRLVTEYWPGWFDQWGGKHADTVSAQLNLYRLAQILASGAQYNLFMFHGGTNFGFWGGRTTTTPACYMTTSYDYDAPLSEAGGRGDKYLTTKRISTFASQFSNVFAHLDPKQHASVIAPDESDHPLSVVHLTGSQGDIVFLLRSENDKRDSANILLPNGLTLPVPLNQDRATWLLLDANLAGVGQLNYTNLCPWALLQKQMLVLFGPAGAEGIVSIDDVPLHVKVPKNRKPLVEQHENLTLVVLNHEQIDAAYPCKHGLAIGASALNEQGEPEPARGWSEMHTISLEGAVTTRKITQPRKPTAPRLTTWERAGVDEYLDGSSDAFEKIDGPTSLEALHCDYGYGWYRLGIGAAKSGKMLAPRAEDRLHLYHDGKLLTIMGGCPGASDEPVDLKLEGNVVVLADNLGRYNFGQDFGQDLKGLYGHIYAVKPVKLPKPKVTIAPGPDPFEVKGMVLWRRRGDQQSGTHITWTLKAAGRKAFVLKLDELPASGVVYINDQPLNVRTSEPTPTSATFLLEPGENGFSTGRNELRLAFYEPVDDPDKIAKSVTLYQAEQNITNRGQWAFAKWTQPSDSDFEKLPAKTPAGPAWYRTQFNAKDLSVPLWLEPRGMSKGQIYINGHNARRYFVATHDGKPVPPQKHYYLPEAWLKTDEPNELVLFDEHGNAPTKCKLVYNANGPYGKA